MLNYSTAENTPPLHVITTTEPTATPSLNKFHLSARIINRAFIAIISFLSVCHAITVYFDYGGLTKTPLMKVFAKLFNLNSERSFPNLFSALILLTASFLLFFIYRVVHRDKLARNRNHWLILSAVFLFLCFDETFSIHEQLIPITQKLLGTSLNGFLHWAWVVPYALLLAVMIVYFWRFVFRLPKTTRNLFFLSGFIYVGGAMGIEMVEGYTYEQQLYVINELLVLVQEVMEMGGIALFIHALLQYIRLQSKTMTVIF